MKQIVKIIETNISKFGILILIISLGFISSCDDNELPDTGDIVDLTPPEALFSATQGIGTMDEWKTYTFSNQSSSATMYSWDFGNGDSSTEFEPSTTFPGEGTYTVSLTASDNLGVESTFTAMIEVVEPIAPPTPDPTLINNVFDKLPKSSGSDCTCSGWINKSLGDQGESSSGNGSDVLKFDNNEPDHIYQEFVVTPNADYTIEIITQFKSLTAGGMFPSMLETRVLAGSGYTSGYAPTYYTDTVDFPQDGYGYASISQVEDAANNLMLEVRSNPNDDSYLTTTYTFNAGNNTSVALFVRGIGGDSAVGNFGYTSGDEEIRLDSVTITAN